MLTSRSWLTGLIAVALVVVLLAFAIFWATTRRGEVGDSMEPDRSADARVLFALLERDYGGTAWFSHVLELQSEGGPLLDVKTDLPSDLRVWDTARRICETTVAQDVFSTVYVVGPDGWLWVCGSRGSSVPGNDLNFQLRSAALGTWLDEDGDPLPDSRPFVMNVYRGAGHCGWQYQLFLRISWPLGTELKRNPTLLDPRARTFVRVPDADLMSGAMFATTFDPDTELPGNARDTGYHLKGWHLWVADETIDRAVWLVHGDAVERWPAAKSQIPCI